MEVSVHADPHQATLTHKIQARGHGKVLVLNNLGDILNQYVRVDTHFHLGSHWHLEEVLRNASIDGTCPPSVHFQYSLFSRRLRRRCLNEARKVQIRIKVRRDGGRGLCRGGSFLVNLSEQSGLCEKIGSVRGRQSYDGILSSAMNPQNEVLYAYELPAL